MSALLQVWDQVQHWNDGIVSVTEEHQVLNEGFMNPSFKHDVLPLGPSDRSRRKVFTHSWSWNVFHIMLPKWINNKLCSGSTAGEEQIGEFQDTWVYHHSVTCYITTHQTEAGAVIWPHAAISPSKSPVFSSLYSSSTSAFILPALPHYIKHVTLNKYITDFTFNKLLHGSGRAGSQQLIHWQRFLFIFLCDLASPTVVKYKSQVCNSLSDVDQEEEKKVCQVWLINKH